MFSNEICMWLCAVDANSKLIYECSDCGNIVSDPYNENGKIKICEKCGFPKVGISYGAYSGDNGKIHIGPYKNE